MARAATLKTPSSDTLDAYWAKYKSDPRYFSADSAVRLVYTTFPDNRQFEHVLLKVSLLNDMYSTNIYGTYYVARHIHELDIDARLRIADLTLVGDVARVTLNGKRFRFYSFASKYCSWHEPKRYPIFDNFVEQLIWAYQRRDGFSSFLRDDLRDYPMYVKILGDFRKAYKLRRKSLQQLDKFLWMYGKELLFQISANVTQPAKTAEVKRPVAITSRTGSPPLRPQRRP